ncbi:hypothetical protein PPL_00489 [Heterostelium album PN500]|uniref:Delta-12 fatty acid desaturase n=1 Tax=Heterostelium pallidum (strain ATCC 26659 / Pp 5 / PN500) TaxID=670386 RepID=D3AWL4_HETP5|nr:hypothetical protein PPL_00489 [Heterostelium album PN500]EFA86687.1 hypothetical protein PPL_00489 [Heterostelium album PN500]|eukprot:XP_020438791.1 hypothetical protein PPL_00489 [Heterostelium album PN500]
MRFNVYFQICDKIIKTMGAGIKQAKEEVLPSLKGAKIDEAVQRGFDIPNFTIKEIRDAIPAHCFERDTLRSMSYVVHDFVIAGILFYLASYIDSIPSFALRMILWPVYWICQGIVCTGLWVLGHECGHQGFSAIKVGPQYLNILYLAQNINISVNYGMGIREFVGLPAKKNDPEGDGPHKLFDESPIMTLLDMIKIFTVGWPIYLLTHLSGQSYSEAWTSHFNPTCALFEKKQFWDVIQSIAGVATMISILAYASKLYGSLAVIKFYVIPYLMVNFWLVLITYLQHTDPKMPHYREGVWNFQRGAALTVDRSYGWILDYFHHHISDTHVAHHFFSTMPHYHAEEATKHIKKVLGKHYIFDPTPIPKALWRSWRECRFVEDEGDVIFYKH